MNDISVLLIEDETALSQLIQEVLNSKGFKVTCATNGINGWSLYKDICPDIVLVDIMLPEKDGISLVRDIRNSGDDLPIIFLTAKSSAVDVIRGLETGADDYVKKPFSIEELMLRIRILVKRAGKKGQNSLEEQAPITKIGRYLYNHKRFELLLEGKAIQLSQREGDLLQMLLQYRNQVLDRKMALAAIWGDDSFFNARSMDVYITRLRKHLSKDASLQIVNIRGKGYRLMD